ncbi:beta-defensin 130-like [Rhinopithecus roxellana]|uniref:beta-defensin 130-like n=1 Tax=Rhinopithecus roxellana TaxID=61622 RepID=UPI0012379223|nr:beta-defensin 130-like [Rhinopithecus roxellana]
MVRELMSVNEHQQKCFSYIASAVIYGKTGVIPGQKQCIALKGVCRDKGCSTLDDTIGTCNEEKKCCRRWWILEPYPTPVPKGKSP